jgi:dihydroorotate dehydrogenase
MRPAISKLPPQAVSHIYSRGRKIFLHLLASDNVDYPVLPDQKFQKKLWEIKFNSPIFNAAGMFKKGEAYKIMAQQGAGGYLAGTATPHPRQGNISAGIRHPFMAYPASAAASNWMGLPNPGASRIAQKLSNIEKSEGCPVGISISATPEDSGLSALEDLVESMSLFQAAGIDFIELNESCPNVLGHEKPESAIDEHLLERIDYIRERFLKIRKRNLPVIVKFSTDTDPAQTGALIDALTDAGFDGVNFGNTSVDYSSIKAYIKQWDIDNYEYFTAKFGGGVSGRPLREKSLALCRAAAQYLSENPPSREFRIIRTGGIASPPDVEESLRAGADLVQWFTGYFDSFARRGHSLYRDLYSRTALPVY